MKLRPAVLDHNVLSLGPPGFAEPLAKGGQQRSIRLGRRPVQVADHRHRLLLRADSGRPRNRRPAGEKNYEISSPHVRCPPLALTASGDYGSKGPPRDRLGEGQLSTPSRPPA